MTDMSITLRDLVARSDASEELKRAAAKLDVFSEWALADLVEEIRQADERYLTIDRAPIDKLYVPLVSIALQAEAEGRGERLALEKATIWDRLSAMTIEGLFEPDQDERLGRYRSWVFVKAAFEAHPDMASITVLDCRTTPREIRRRLSERQGFGSGLVKAILDRAIEWEHGEWPTNESYQGSLAWMYDQSFRRQLQREISRRDERDGLEKALSILSDKQRQVLSLRHGLGDDRTMRTFKDIASIMGLSTTTVSKMDGKAMRMLKHPDLIEGVRSYLSARAPVIHLALANEAGIITDGRAGDWWELVDPKDKLALTLVGHWRDISDWLSSRLERNAFGWIYEKPDTVVVPPVIDDVDLEALSNVR